MGAPGRNEIHDATISAVSELVGARPRSVRSAWPWPSGPAFFRLSPARARSTWARSCDLGTLPRRPRNAWPPVRPSAAPLRTPTGLCGQDGVSHLFLCRSSRLRQAQGPHCGTQPRRVADRPDQHARNAGGPGWPGPRPRGTDRGVPRSPQRSAVPNVGAERLRRHPYRPAGYHSLSPDAVGPAHPWFRPWCARGRPADFPAARERRGAGGRRATEGRVPGGNVDNSRVAHPPRGRVVAPSRWWPTTSWATPRSKELSSHCVMSRNARAWRRSSSTRLSTMP